MTFYSVDRGHPLLLERQGSEPIEGGIVLFSTARLQPGTCGFRSAQSLNNASPKCIMVDRRMTMLDLTRIRRSRLCGLAIRGS